MNNVCPPSHPFWPPALRLWVGLAGLGGILTFVGCSPPPYAPLAHRQAEQQQHEQDTAKVDQDRLRDRIDAVLQRGLLRRRLSTQRNAAWQIMHGVICYGRDLQIETPDQGIVSAVDYAFGEGLIHGFELKRGTDPLPSTQRYGVTARVDPGSYQGQGHVDQWLAIFAMADLPLDTPLSVAGERFTLLDWARQAQYDVPHNLLDEFSWTLIALTHYFPDEPTWLAAGDTELSWELLVEAELTYDINLSPCGGTHRLAGIVRALRAKQRLQLPDSQVWTQAQQLVDNLLQDARQQRAADGRLSSYYFTRPGTTVDLTADLASTGHVFEFVALAASTKELSEPWITLSANHLCDLLDATQTTELDCGALYHALNGLQLYRQRVSANNVDE